MPDGTPTDQSFSAGLFGRLGDLMHEKLQDQMAQEDNLRNQKMQMYMDMIRSGRLSPEQAQELWGHITKLSGNSKGMKGLIQRFGQVFNIGHGLNQMQQQGQPGSAPGIPGAAAPAGVPRYSTGNEPWSEQLPGVNLQPLPSTKPVGPPVPPFQPVAAGSPASPSQVQGPAPVPARPSGPPSRLRRIGQKLSAIVNPPEAPEDPDFGAMASAAFPKQLSNEEMENLISKHRIDEAEAKPGTPKSMSRRVLGSNLPAGVKTMDGLDPDPNKHYDLFSTGRKGPDGNPEMVATESGELASQSAPKRFNYVGADGKEHQGFTVGAPPDMKVYDDMNHEMNVDPEIFSAWMQTRTTTTQGWKEVPQPDGSIKLIPVTTTSTRTAGNAPPPPTPAPASAKPPKSSPRAIPPAAPPPSQSSLGRVVGGKVPPGVQKAYDAYSGSIERYNIMTEALPEALKGSQQAMINLLYNHIGMTLGIQRGARITQTVIDEAQNSAPWVQSIMARFRVGDEFQITPALLRGIALAPQQMHQMVQLAQERLQQDKDFFDREVAAAKVGYGMTGQVPGEDNKPPAKPSASGGPPPAPPKNSDELGKSLGLTPVTH